MNGHCRTGMRGESKARQHTIVGEGLALACVAAGLPEFNGHKMTIQLSLQQAWRDWPYRARFPAVHEGIERNDLLGIIARSPRRRSQPGVAGWNGEWPFLPYVDADLDLDQAGEALEQFAAFRWMAGASSARP